MSKATRKKILVLVEGAKTDVALMERLLSLYQIDAKYEIVSYCTNIYQLYREMFQDGEDSFEELDLLQVLKSREKDSHKKKLFDAKYNRYTDVLLVFDFDPQDPNFDPEHIQMMQRYFSESSDMGQLYLNYPMVEAFYHMSQIPDEDYPEKMATLAELRARGYKGRVRRETKNHDYRKFVQTREDCSIVILQNLQKACFLSTGRTVNWKEALCHSQEISHELILQKQCASLKDRSLVAVLCTCVFYIAEYNPERLLPGEVEN